MCVCVCHRFKYREVPAADYGLSVDDILQHSDKDLNQVCVWLCVCVCVCAHVLTNAYLLAQQQVVSKVSSTHACNTYIRA